MGSMFSAERIELEEGRASHEMQYTLVLWRKEGWWNVGMFEVDIIDVEKMYNIVLLRNREEGYRKSEGEKGRVSTGGPGKM